jgi:hypothetical protein
LRSDSAAFHLLQLVHADDPSTHIAGAGARHEQLRQRVGESFARACKLQRAVAAARPCCESCGARVRHPLQVYIGSDDGAGETSGMVALGSCDEERSKQAAIMAPE